VYSTGEWHYGKREGVAPKKLIKPDADRHRVKSSWKLRPLSEWCKPQKLEGGSIWTQAQQEAIVQALERNGRMENGKPAAQDGY